MGSIAAMARTSKPWRRVAGVAVAALAVLSGCGGGGNGAFLPVPPSVSTSYTIGGTLSGLSGTVVVRNNAGNDLTLKADGAFAFTDAVIAGNPYAVTIAQQPQGQTCTVTAGQGTATANVSDVRVVCTAVTRTIGGTISGLTGAVVLQNNAAETLKASSDGAFAFPTPVSIGTAYVVTVAVQPSGQTCSVSRGAGTAGADPIDNVAVVCSSNSYTVGGALSGLVGTAVLQNNAGDALTISADGTFTFPVPVAYGSGYAVTVTAQPATQTCSVASGSGTMSAANVTNVKVVCATNAYAVGGTISGLSGSLVLQNNAADNLSASASGVFTFATPVATGSTYNVTVLAQPVSQTCTVTNGAGIVGSANVSNLVVACTQNFTTLSVSSSPLVIAVKGASSALTVTNTGAFLATNVTATLPGGWSAVIQDASACTSLMPGASCALSFSSPTPYVASGAVSIQGDNTSLASATIGFSLNGFPIFDVPSASTATVVDSADLSGRFAWGGDGTTTGANSLTDGASNTQALLVSLGAGNSAASRCAASTRSGLSWYLPAICQLTSFSWVCAANQANIQQNLINRGLVDFGGQLYRWSSSESTASPSDQAFEHRTDNIAFDVTKAAGLPIRCVASVSW